MENEKKEQERQTMVRSAKGHRRRRRRRKFAAHLRRLCLSGLGMAAAILICSMAVKSLAALGERMFSQTASHQEQENTKDVSLQEEQESISIEDALALGEIPMLFQTDPKWADTSYGNGSIEKKGCGPTCLSMVASWLLKDASLSPVKIARKSEEWGYVEAENGTSWKLMTVGADQLGLISTELPLMESKMEGALSQGKLLILAMGPGDFTTEGHFIVVTGYQDGAFLIHDPNSMANSKRRWSYDELEGQVRNLWSFEAKSS